MSASPAGSREPNLCAAMSIIAISLAPAGPARRRLARLLRCTALGAVAGVATVAWPAAARAQQPASQTEASRTEANREVVRRAFDAWARGGTRFFHDVLAPDVVWTISGSGPSARAYRGRQAFLDSAVAPFAARLSAPLVPTVRGLWADGDQVIARFDGRATARDGRPYRNSYAWLFTMRGGRAVAVTAFLDLPAYDAVLARVRPAPR